jgi:hypothetical protein
MVEGTRGWQQLNLKPEVWNKHRGVSICANLSSTDGSIITARGMVLFSPSLAHTLYPPPPPLPLPPWQQSYVIVASCRTVCFGFLPQ